MPYPESCPECGGAFRNTGTHFTARRNEVGRHVLLELGCQTTSRRFWWDFTTGQLTADGRAARATARGDLVTTVAANANGANAATGGSNGAHANASHGATTASGSIGAHASNNAAASGSTGAHAAATNGHAIVATLDPPSPEPPMPTPDEAPTHLAEPTTYVEMGPPATAPQALKDAFVRQLQLDRLTLRQMRSWLMADDARRAIEVAAGATEATYERLALILFGADLPQLLGKQAPAPPPPSMSAEERLELQREKARIRARLRRAAIKAAKEHSS